MLKYIACGALFIILVILFFIYQVFAYHMIGKPETTSPFTYNELKTQPPTPENSLVIKKPTHLVRPIKFILDFDIPFVLLPGAIISISEYIVLNKYRGPRCIYRGKFRRNRPIIIQNLLVDRDTMKLKLTFYIFTKRVMWGWQTAPIDISKNSSFRILLHTDHLGYDRVKITPID